MLVLRKNTASQHFNVQLLNRSDGTDLTSGTPTVQVKKDGGAYANIAGSISHDANGSWEVSPTAADTNFDDGSFKVTLTNAITVTMNATTDPRVSLADNGITAAKIAASALNGKGNWNIGKTGYSLTQAFPTNFADMAIAATTGIVEANQKQINDIAVTDFPEVHLSVPAAMPIPDPGSSTVRFDIGIVSKTGASIEPDGAPGTPMIFTSVVNGADTDRSGNLGSLTRRGNGDYYIDYTIANTHDVEVLYIKVGAMVDGAIYGSTRVMEVGQPQNIGKVNDVGISIEDFNNLAAVDGQVVTGPDDLKADVSNVTVGSLSGPAIASIMAGGNIDGRTLEEALRLIGASTAGVLSGVENGMPVFKGINGSAKNRISATTDENGNRTAITEDVTP